MTEASLFSAPGPQNDWLEALLRRHQETLTFQELRRCVKALSLSYTQRRHHLGVDKPLSRGKQAAFSAYYTPLHIELVARSLGAMGATQPRNLLDLGAGTGAATLAFWAHSGVKKESRLVDLAPWALQEAKLNLMGHNRPYTLRAGLWRPSDIAQLGKKDACVMAFFLNELDSVERDRVWEALLEAQARGASAYVLEPISRAVTPWWDAWVDRARAHGGQALEGRWPVSFPPAFALLGRAAGLDHRVLTARMWRLVPLTS